MNSSSTLFVITLLAFSQAIILRNEPKLIETGSKRVMSWPGYGIYCAGYGGYCHTPVGWVCGVRIGRVGGAWTVNWQVSGGIHCVHGHFVNNAGLPGDSCYYFHCWQPDPPARNVEGDIINASTGNLIKRAGTSVVFTSGNQRINAVVKDGRYSAKLTDGNWKRTTNAPTFTEQIRQVHISANVLENIPLSKKEAGWRMILTWNGRVNRDLDAIFQFGDGQMVYYNEKTINYGNGVGRLDLDSTHGIKPETITIRGVTTGTGTFQVQNYSKEVEFSRTGASVALYKDGREVRVFNVPTTGNGQYWSVFSIDFETQEFTPINQFN